MSRLLHRVSRDIAVSNLSLALLGDSMSARSVIHRLSMKMYLPSLLLVVACGSVRDQAPADSGIDAPSEDATLDAATSIDAAPDASTEACRDTRIACGAAASVCCNVDPDLAQPCQLAPLPSGTLSRTFAISGQASPNNHRYQAVVIDAVDAGTNTLCVTVTNMVGVGTRPISVDFVRDQLACSGPIGSIATAYDMNSPSTRTTTVAVPPTKRILVGVEPSYATASGSALVKLEVRAGACM